MRFFHAWAVTVETCLAHDVSPLHATKIYVHIIMGSLVLLLEQKQGHHVDPCYKFYYIF